MTHMTAVTVVLGGMQRNCFHRTHKYQKIEGVKLQSNYASILTNRMDMYMCVHMCMPYIPLPNPKPLPLPR